MKYSPRTKTQKRDSEGCGNGEVRRERKKRDQRRRQNSALAPRSEGGESILRLALLSLSSLPRNSVSTTLCTVQSLIIALWYEIYHSERIAQMLKTLVG